MTPILFVQLADRMNTFTKSGFSNWKHASDGSGKLTSYAKSRKHLLSLKQNFESGTPVNFHLNEAAHEIKKRQEGVKSSHC